MHVDFKNPLFYIVPFFGLLLTFFIFIEGGANTEYLWRESLLVEDISALGYVVGFFLFLYAFYRAPGKSKALWFVLWALLCLISFGEETSWLQHELGYQTPETIRELNTQNEFNLHNLDFFQSHSVTNGLNWRSFLTAQHLFQLGFLGYFLLLPLGCKLIPMVHKLSFKLHMPIPGIRLIVFIWTPLFITIALAILSLDDPLTKQAMAELREMFLGLGLGMFGLSVILKMRSQQAEASR